jgi:hypothetical protein
VTYCAQTIRGVWALYEHVIDQDPFPARPQGATGRVAPLGVACRISDILSLRQFRRLDLHAEICRPLGVNHVDAAVLRRRRDRRQLPRPAQPTTRV